jgi:hypothetical protein
MKKHWMLVLMLVSLVLTSCGAKAVEQMTDASWEEGAARAPSMVAQESAVEYDEMNAATGDITPMIIYNGSLDLVVLDSAKAQEDVQKLVEEFKGYVMASDSYRYEQGSVKITMKLRVPAAQFNELMSRLRKMALEVNHDSVSSENVTQEYVDLESRLRALEAKAARLEELMEDAEDTEAVLAVYRELSATQQEIEQVKGRMQYLERSASMATIIVTLTPDALSQPVEVAGWRPQGTAKRAVEAMLNALQFLGDAFIWILLFVAPVLAVIGGAIYLVIKLLSRLFGRRKRSRQPAAPVTPAETK